MNLVELHFSIVQGKIVKPANFADLGQLEEGLFAAQDRHNATASPFTGATSRHT